MKLNSDGGPVLGPRSTLPWNFISQSFFCTTLIAIRRKGKIKDGVKEGTRPNEAFHGFGRLLKEADAGVSILRGSRRERIEIKEIIKSTLGQKRRRKFHCRSMELRVPVWRLRDVLYEIMK